MGGARRMLAGEQSDTGYEASGGSKLRSDNPPTLSRWLRMTKSRAAPIDPTRAPQPRRVVGPTLVDSHQSVAREEACPRIVLRMKYWD